MHSGWGALVAVSGDAESIEIIDRRRIVIIDASIAGAKQPYHHAANLALGESEKHLGNCAEVSEGLAAAAVSDVIKELQGRDYEVVGCAILLASGRPLPALSSILASHPLIHTAEGEFFRDAIRKACARLELSVTAIRERDLDEQAKMAFANAANRMQHTISSLGRSIGPPWTKDHKAAALAASIILAREQNLLPEALKRVDRRGQEGKVRHAIRYL